MNCNTQMYSITRYMLVFIIFPTRWKGPFVSFYIQNSKVYMLPRTKRICVYCDLNDIDDELNL